MSPHDIFEAILMVIVVITVLLLLTAALLVLASATLAVASLLWPILRSADSDGQNKLSNVSTGGSYTRQHDGNDDYDADYKNSREVDDVDDESAFQAYLNSGIDTATIGASSSLPSSPAMVSVTPVTTQNVSASSADDKFHVRPVATDDISIRVEHIPSSPAVSYEQDDDYDIPARMSG
jgi:hypothetical protein